MLRPRTLLATALAVGLTCSVAAPAFAHGGSAHGASGAKSAVQLYTESIEPLGMAGGVSIDGAAYGSSFTAKPGAKDVFYGLTDRGPNVDGPQDVKVEPLPDFTPAIGEFRLRNGRATLLKRIPLRAADGTPYNGQTSLAGSTGETIVDLNGKELPASPYGYDPEGIAAMRDGTFWVSDEYGPFITHFSPDGRQLERLSPFDGSLPVELSERQPNKGMEGLTITPDGRTLVGIMQAGLNAPDGPKSKNVNAVRIVTIDLRTRRTAQYIYLLHSDKTPTTAVSEISALNNHEFLVDERDGDVEPGANKKLFRIDLRGATDVGRFSTVPNTTYDATNGGLRVSGRTIEATVGKDGTTTATADLAAVGITPVRSSLFLDVAGLVTAIDPKGGFYGHDKVEGVAVVDGGSRVVISNDSDFGIDALGNDTAPYTLHAKMLPNGKQDTGELLAVDMKQVPAQFR
ncbi:MAG TPA: esterase-like activity of phytase family protein [Flexivirga sp.]|uniref:esterase-like activity of phytase family protein n=1 Tax=Flexivirga sp. TaxID=1962927 RepID=UPI002C2E754B|nr:esterase-like activity of phytase family protein [Flexivirga sp.]HWC22526.1 esterase-like activity of phytase family protein [Flexivirga sp.]